MPIWCLQKLQLNFDLIPLMNLYGYERNLSQNERWDVKGRSWCWLYSTSERLRCRNLYWRFFCSWTNWTRQQPTTDHVEEWWLVGPCMVNIRWHKIQDKFSCEQSYVFVHPESHKGRHWERHLDRNSFVTRTETRHLSVQTRRGWLPAHHLRAQWIWHINCVYYCIGSCESNC